MTKIKSLNFNMILNLVRTIFTSLFPLISFKYIASVLGQDSFGKLNYAYSIVQYFTIFAALGISTYAIRECARLRDDDKKCSHLASELFTLNFISMLLSYILLGVLLLFSKHLSDYRTLIIIQSASIFFSTIGVDWINQVYEDYLYITCRTVIIQIISLILIIVFIKSENDYLLYAFITSTSTAIINIANIFYVKKYVHIKFVFNAEIFRHLKSVFLLFFMNLAISIYVSSDVTIIGILKNDNDVAIYSVGTKIYSCMKTLVVAVITVTIPRLAYYIDKDKEKYEKNIEYVLTIILTLIIPLVTLIETIPEFAINLLSNVKYMDAIATVRVFGIALIPTMISTVINNGILIIQRQEKKILMNTIISAVINVVLNFLFIPRCGFIAASFTTLFSEILVCIMCIIQSKKTIQNLNSIKFLINVGKSFIGGIYIIIIYFLVSICMKKNILFYIVYGGVSIVGYLFIEYISKQEIIYNILKCKLLRREKGKI